MCMLPLKRAANVKPSPCIPVKILFHFHLLASNPCAEVSGSEEVPVQSRYFNGVRSHVFVTTGDVTLVFV